MSSNPYTPGESPPRVLVGRDGELARIDQLLTRVVDAGEMAGPPLVFTAPRGVGKTSVLRVAADAARERGLVTVWVSCVRREPLLGDLTAALGRAMSELDYVGRHDRISSYQVEAGLLGLKAGATFQRTAAAADATGLVSAVEHRLLDAARLIRRKGGAGLALFLDEVHAPDLRETGILLNAVQNLAADRANNPVAVIGAGLPSTPAHLTAAATFGERSTFVPLPRLSQSAALQALIDPAGAAGVLWAADAAAAVEQGARGFPYFVQLLGAAAWDAARPNPGDTITLEHVRTAAGTAATQILAMFTARWESATDGERDFMEAMAACGDVATRGEIADALGKHTRQLSVVRARLIDKGIIEAAGHGRLRFTLPGFAGYVRAQSHGTLDTLDPLALPPG